MYELRTFSLEGDAVTGQFKLRTRGPAAFECEHPLKAGAVLIGEDGARWMVSNEKFNDNPDAPYCWAELVPAPIAADELEIPPEPTAMLEAAPAPRRKSKPAEEIDAPE